MTVTGRAGFIRTILAAPGDNTPRLVFADWLDENGEPGRAELIRVQVDLAQRPRCDRCGNRGFTKYGLKHEACRCGRDRQHRRERDALSAATPGLQREIAGRPIGYGLLRSKPAGAGGEALWLERGFVGVASLTCRNFLDCSSDVFAANPVERVELIDRRPEEIPLRRFESPAYFVWWREPSPRAEAATLPAVIYDQLRRACEREGLRAEGWPQGAGAQDGLAFLDEADAVTALSGACLAFGRGSTPP